MPTILRVKGYRIGFFSADIREPAHVHVAKDAHDAKFWLQPLALARNRGFARQELNEIDGILRQHQQHLLNQWHEYFG